MSFNMRETKRTRCLVHECILLWRTHQSKAYLQRGHRANIQNAKVRAERRKAAKNATRDNNARTKRKKVSRTSMPSSTSTATAAADDDDDDEKDVMCILLDGTDDDDDDFE